MIEVLLILTFVFIAYIVYTLVSAYSAGGRRVETGTVEVEPLPPASQGEAEAVAEPEAKIEEEAEASKTEAGPSELRNPETGEVAAVPANYRFAKRWIKEAMVAEGLLERIYKNNELDYAASEKVKAALESFKLLEKYHA